MASHYINITQVVFVCLVEMKLIRAIKRKKTELLIALVATFVSLFIAEGACRIFLPPVQIVEVLNTTSLTPKDPKTPTRTLNDKSLPYQFVITGGAHGIRMQRSVSGIVKNHSLSKKDVNIAINSLGLRYPELNTLPENAYRVLVLGDSITMSDYTQDFETIPNHLEQLAHKSGKQIAFINAGLATTGTNDQLYHYLELRDYVEPDMVLIMMFLDDARTAQNFQTTYISKPWASSRLLSYIVREFDVLRHLAVAQREVGSHKQIDDATIAEFKKRYSPHNNGDIYNNISVVYNRIIYAKKSYGLGWSKKSWDVIKESLFAFKDDTSAHDTKLMVALLPVDFQVFGSVRDSVPQSYFKEMCAQLEIDCYDLLPMLQEYADKNIEPSNLYYDYGHMTPKGNQIVAGIIYEWLKQFLPQRALPES